MLEGNRVATQPARPLIASGKSQWVNSRCNGRRGEEGGKCGIANEKGSSERCRRNRVAPARETNGPALAGNGISTNFVDSRDQSLRRNNPWQAGWHAICWTATAAEGPIPGGDSSAVARWPSRRKVVNESHDKSA